MCVQHTLSAGNSSLLITSGVYTGHTEGRFEVHIDGAVNGSNIGTFKWRKCEQKIFADTGLVCNSFATNTAITVNSSQYLQEGLSVRFSDSNFPVDVNGAYVDEWWIGISATNPIGVRNNDGNTTMVIGQDGSLHSTGGATIAGGIVVTTDGVVVQAGGLSVAAGGLDVAQGSVTVAGGLHVQTGGLNVTGGGGVFQDGLEVGGGAVVIEGGLSVEQNGANISGGLNISGVLTVLDSGIEVVGGITFSGGLTISDTGLFIEAGGLTVAADGLTVEDGMVVHDGLNVSR